MSEILGKETKQLSNPYSTGSGGSNFERHVQTFFILSMIVGGKSPGVDGHILQIDFQAKHLGYHTDDLLITTDKGEKLLCQIKHSISFTKGSRIFQDVITAMWNDFTGHQFNDATDRLALITDILPKTYIDALKTIHNQAVSASDEDNYIQRIEQGRFVNNTVREKFRLLKDYLNAAKGDKISDKELWLFCKAFLLVVYDGDYKASVHETLCKTLIRCKSAESEEMVWGTLSDYAGQCNQNASSLSKETLPTYILELFGIKTTTNLPAHFEPSERWADIVLAGAWDGTNSADRNALERITGSGYSDILQFSKQNLTGKDSVLSLSSNVWRVSRREEILSLTEDYFFDEAITAAFAEAKIIFAEISKCFSGEEYSILVPEGGCFSNSDSFRKGLCEGLCLLANSSAPKHSTDTLLEMLAAQLVQHFFENCTWKTLVSMGDLLPIFAEISPKVFVQKLELFVIEKPEEIRKLFPGKNAGSVFSTNHITQILWSLERLAWIPELLIPCIRCLGVIEQVGYEKTNYGNTPINSITTILNPFCSQTFASKKQKKDAIEALCKDSPDICWKVIQSLLPNGSFFLVETQKPQFINVGKYECKGDGGSTNELLQEYVEIALRLSKNNPERIADLVEHSSYMTQNVLDTCIDQIITSASTWEDETKYTAWNGLCNLRIRLVLDNNRKEPHSQRYSRLLTAIQMSKPESKWYQDLRLYSGRSLAYLLNPSRERWMQQEKEKTDAIYELYCLYGIDSVRAFGKRVNNLVDVGRKLGAMLKLSDILEILSNFSQQVESDFYPHVLTGNYYKAGASTIKEWHLSDYATGFRMKVLCALPFDPGVFRLTESLLPDSKVYWAAVPVSWASPDWEKKDSEYAISNLILAGRYVAIINAFGDFAESDILGASKWMTVLKGAAVEKTEERFQPYTISQIIKKLQESKNIDIDALAEVEFIYLPLLGEDYDVKPRALYWKLGNDPNYFCHIMELMYKPRHGKKLEKSLPDNLADRLFKIVFMYCVVPGVDWNGKFSADQFHEWISAVLPWAKESDRISVVQHTIGNGLSYAEKKDGLPNEVIMEELNKPENAEMRNGYSLGLQNQRGVYTVDPEGKPELQLSEMYRGYAENAETLGYSRFADTLRSISESYFREAEYNRKQNLRDN